MGQAPNAMLEILSLSKNKFQSGIWAGGIRRGAIIILVNYLWGAPKQWFQGVP